MTSPTSVSGVLQRLFATVVLSLMVMLGVWTLLLLVVLVLDSTEPPELLLPYRDVLRRVGTGVVLAVGVGAGFGSGWFLWRRTGQELVRYGAMDGSAVEQ